jgi:Tol biopolymer transport system component
LVRLGALLGLIALIMAGGIWLYQTREWGKMRVAGAPIKRRFDTHGGVPYRVAISPDGKSLAYIQRLKGKYSLWLGQIDSNSSVAVYEQPDLLLDNLHFSPDGANLYFSVGGDRPQMMLVRMPAVGGPLTELLPRVRSYVTFSPDGRQLSYLRRDENSRETSIVTRVIE